MRDPLNIIVRDQKKNGVKFVPVETTHVYALSGLLMYHKDPFDRIIIATAIKKGAVLLSADGAMGAYTPALSFLW